MAVVYDMQNNPNISMMIKHSENHPNMATSYNNLGALHSRLGNTDKALDYWNRSVAIKLKILGDNHPELASSYHKIAILYEEQGDLDKALEYFNKSLDIRLSSVGTSNADVTTYHCLS